MNQQIKVEDLRVFIKTRFADAGYSQDRIRKFCKTAERLYEYMAIQKMENYTPEVGLRFVQTERLSGEVGIDTLRTDRRAIDVINLVLAGSPISIRRKTVVRQYPGDIGEVSVEFLKYLETEVRSAQSSLVRYACVLSPFSVYCQMRGITLQTIDYKAIVGYMSSRQNSDSKTFSVLRIFFRHLHETGLLEKDYSLEITSAYPKRREKIPSFYSRDEILRIENGIERTSPSGKRDYAIIKLASRLGLRASDIARLEFSNMDWESNVIALRQRKTGKLIELPLLADVGNAVIDYVRNGRPRSQSRTILLTYVSPHRPMTTTAISNIVSKRITDAGIDINGRRHGAHCLRHSLAYNMLATGSTLGMISDALGHTSVESTMSYMGIDVGRLMECSLAVPPVEAAFYNQKGGLLYE